MSQIVERTWVHVGGNIYLIHLLFKMAPFERLQHCYLTNNNNSSNNNKVHWNTKLTIINSMLFSLLLLVLYFSSCYEIFVDIIVFTLFITNSNIFNTFDSLFKLLVRLVSVRPKQRLIFSQAVSTCYIQLWFTHPILICIYIGLIISIYTFKALSIVHGFK